VPIAIGLPPNFKCILILNVFQPPAFHGAPRRYRAWYYDRQSLDALVEAAGFKRYQDPRREAQRLCTGGSEFVRSHDGRPSYFKNVIKAYYRVYVPVGEFRHKHSTGATATRTPIAGAASGLTINKTPQNAIIPIRDPSVKPAPTSTIVDNGHEVFESKKHRGSFYILGADGSAQWVTVLADDGGNYFVDPAAGGRVPIKKIHHTS
jgi:hypothetical protein